MLQRKVRSWITSRQFEQLQERVSGKKRSVKKTPVVPLAHKVVLGIDPSLRGTGYGVFRLGRSGPKAVAQWTVKCSAKLERSRWLHEISSTIREVVCKHQPTVCAIEGLFYAQNVKTALTMGEARGAALAVLAEAGLEIFEIAPRKV